MFAAKHVVFIIGFVLAVFILSYIIRIIYFVIREILQNIIVATRLHPLVTHFTSSKRILFFIPHPDDEITCCFSLIKQAVEHKCKILVVMATNGDGVGIVDRVSHWFGLRPPSFLTERAKKRIRETQIALVEMGIHYKDVIFLGFPDGGLLDLFRNFWKKNTIYSSPYTQRNSSNDVYTPYPNTPFTGHNLSTICIDIVRKFKPTHVVYPNHFDRHADHMALHNFVKYALYTTNTSVEEITYLAHRGQWPIPFTQYSSLRVLAPAGLIKTKVSISTMRLTTEEMRLKEHLSRIYQTQWENPLMRQYLLSFIRKNEIYFIQHPRVALKNVIKKNEPFRIVNPSSDLLICNLNKGADITELRIHAVDTQFIIQLFTTHTPSKKYHYIFDLFFKNKKGHPLRICVQTQRDVMFVHPASDIIPSYDDVCTRVHDDNIEFKMEIPHLADFSHVMIISATYKHRTLVDKIGPYYVQLPVINANGVSK